ncbi:MAG: hypothetical protein ACK5QT_08430, partial [Oligoflexia bacterium]
HAQAAPTCSMAVPFAWGESPKLSEDRVLYSREDRFSGNAPVGSGRTMAVYDFNYQMEFAPIFVPQYVQSFSDIEYGISKDWVYWIRTFGSFAEVHVANVYPPYQHTVLDTALPHTQGGVHIALEQLSGGHEFAPADRNDFVLSWIKTAPIPGGISRTLRWCRIQDCLAFNITDGLPAYIGPTTPGNQPNQAILSAHLSQSGGGGPGAPGVVYHIEDRSNGYSTSWESTYGAAHSSIAPFSGGLAHTISQMDWSGLYIGMTREWQLGQTAVSLSLPVLQYPATLFTSSPGLGENDSGMSVSRAMSSQGQLMFAFTRDRNQSANTSSVTLDTEVRVGFYSPLGTTTDVAIQVPPLPWSACSEASVFGNRVVMTCRDPVDPRLIPILFESICSP